MLHADSLHVMTHIDIASLIQIHGEKSRSSVHQNAGKHACHFGVAYASCSDDKHIHVGLQKKQLTPVDDCVLSGWTNAIHVRVGNKSQTLATRRGFDTNAWCALQLSVSGQQDINCATPVHGRYVSIQSVDNILTEQLRLCDVTVY